MGKAASLVVKMAETFDRGDVDGAVECFAPNATFVNPVASCQGHDEIRSLLQTFATAFPDLVHSPTNVVESGDTVAIEFLVTGTHTGTLMSPMGEIPPTGKSVTLGQGSFSRVERGKIVELRGYWDVAAFMQQLGVMREPAAARA
jgi:steroid delta-isomerase-like uncharacterized protein